jgi:hypothetical protein
MVFEELIVVGISRLGSRWAPSPTPIYLLVVLDHEVRVVSGWKINSTGHAEVSYARGGSPSFVVFSVGSAARAGGVAVWFADRGLLSFPSQVMFGFGAALFTVEGYPFYQVQTSPSNALIPHSSHRAYNRPAPKD